MVIIPEAAINSVRTPKLSGEYNLVSIGIAKILII